jgi:dipeptidyl aminopeptidase/acylaminoacyl peptidase
MGMLMSYTKKILCLLLLLCGTACNPALDIPIKEFEVPAQDFEKNGFTIPAKFIGSNPKSATIFWCHGGPHSSHQEELENLQNLAYEFNINIVVFDFRGSIIKGYSHVAQQYNDPNKLNQYASAGDRDYGGIHMDDLRRVMDYVKVHFADKTDVSKWAIGGESFGGYMVALAITDPKLTHYFKLAIAISGFYDLGTYAQQNVVSFDKNADIERRRSPIKFVQNISQPVLVFLGDEEEDKTTLVSYQDTQDFVKAAEKLHKDIHAFFFPGLKHGYVGSLKKTWELARPWIEKLK